jgi:hypothetical protein
MFSYSEMCPYRPRLARPPRARGDACKRLITRVAPCTAWHSPKLSDDLIPAAQATLATDLPDRQGTVDYLAGLAQLAQELYRR